MSSRRNRIKLRPMAGLTAAVLSGAALLGVGATPASATTGTQIVNIADANIGKGVLQHEQRGRHRLRQQLHGRSGDHWPMPVRGGWVTSSWWCSIRATWCRPRGR